MKLTKSSAVQHPEGWHLFKIEGEEEGKGKYGTQIKWTLRSEVKNEDTGEPITLIYFTGCALSTHESCKLTDLFIAAGIFDSRKELSDMTDTDFEGMDSGLIIGKVIEGRVDAPKTEGGYCNIGATRRRKPAQKATKITKREEEADFHDPFEDE